VARPAETAFNRIVCAVDPLAPSSEAVDQAIALAWANTGLTFLAVNGNDGSRSALDAAVLAAANRGIGAEAHAVRGENAPEAVIEASASADLLVVGSRGAGGTDVALGRTASAAVHAAPKPVLIARPVPERHAFPGRMLVATDGSPDAAHGVDLAHRIASAHVSEVTLVHVFEGRSPPLEAGSGETVIEEFGDPVQRISEVAARERSSLLLIGSRGLGRARVLGSVGERLAHAAPCSVLVVRGAS
jgi:nucleotide-binding universal stress UspA family protein